MKGLGSLESFYANASYCRAWLISGCVGALFSLFLVLSYTVPSGEHLIGMPKKKTRCKSPLPPKRMKVRIPIVVGAFVGSPQATIL